MKGLFWKTWAVLLVLSILWLGWAIKTSQPAKAQNGVADEIRAKAFVLVDDDGNIRAGMTAFEDTADIAFFNAQGKVRALLGVLANGGVSLVFSDPRGHIRTVLGATPDAGPRLYFMDEEGHKLFSAP